MSSAEITLWVPCQILDEKETFSVYGKKSCIGMAHGHSLFHSASFREIPLTENTAQES